ncbi:hypothetical protein [Amazonocrinis nigriterrae]|nr:hypothetical protein [Amazonocrinis nigriterrae]
METTPDAPLGEGVAVLVSPVPVLVRQLLHLGKAQVEQLPLAKR